MLSIEYTLLLSFTVAAFTTAGSILAPAIADYRADLRLEILENRQLVQQLEQTCWPGGAP